MTMSLLKKAGAAAAAADGPEGALRALLSPLHEGLGDQQTQLDEQFFVAGAFMIAPDAEWHMLVGNIGFPPEQARLMIPIAGGHPGSVFTSKEALHLPDTHAVAGSFKQYLKTARMGSAMYVPMIWNGQFLGQIVMAAKVRNTLSATDFATFCAAVPMASAVWVAQSGDVWLRETYPPTDGFLVGVEGMT